MAQPCAVPRLAPAGTRPAWQAREEGGRADEGGEGGKGSKGAFLACTRTSSMHAYLNNAPPAPFLGRQSTANVVHQVIN